MYINIRLQFAVLSFIPMFVVLLIVFLAFVGGGLRNHQETTNQETTRKVLGFGGISQTCSGPWNSGTKKIGRIVKAPVQSEHFFLNAKTAVKFY